MILVKRKINVYRVSMCSTSTTWACNTNTHLPPFSQSCLNLSPSPLIIHTSPLSLSLSLSLSLPLSSFCPAQVLSPMPTDSHLPPPRPLPSLFVSRSVDQFSVWLVGWSPLWLPRPSHLSLTPTYSPCEHMVGCGAWTCGGFNKYISALVSSWQGSRVGYSVCNPEGGGVCTRACVFVSGWCLHPMTLLHAACYHRRRMCGCAHVACLSALEGWVWVYDRRSSYLILEGFRWNEKLLFNFIIQ